MKRIFIFITVRIVLLFVLAKPAYALDVVAGQSAQMVTPVSIAEIQPEPEVVSKQDERVAKLESFLQSHNSPLADYAPLFIAKADEYGLPDWKLVPAITGVESTFGKAIPYNSFNAYGWANGVYSFRSWEESIDVVTKTLKEKYMDRGADTVEKIAHIYAPPSATWAGKVRFFMEKIDAQQTTTAVDQRLALSL